MKQFLNLAFFAFLSSISCAFADPKSDATYIVEQHMLVEDYEGKISLDLQGMLKRLRPAFESLGAEIIDPEKFLSELVGDYVNEYRNVKTPAKQDIKRARRNRQG